MTILYKFCKAIEKYEGYTIGSLTWRNNNPGALRWSPFQVGQKNKFSYFNSYEDGFRALMWDAEQKCLGNTSSNLGPEKTILDFFKVWSPSSDGNNPFLYAQTVSKEIGFTSDSKLKEIISEEKTVQRILCVLNNFSKQKEIVIKDAMNNLEYWFDELGIETQIDFFSEATPTFSVKQVEGIVGENNERKFVSVLDPELIKKYLQNKINGHHFVLFCYYQDNPGLAPTEFSEIFKGAIITQLPILGISNQEWIANFAAHELLHGLYARASFAGISVKDDVHMKGWKDGRPEFTYDSIIKGLLPHSQLIFKPISIIEVKISLIQKILNLMKELLSILMKGR